MVSGMGGETVRLFDGAAVPVSRPICRALLGRASVQNPILRYSLLFLLLLVLITVPTYFITSFATRIGKPSQRNKHYFGDIGLTSNSAVNVRVEGGGSSFADEAYSDWCQAYSDSNNQDVFIS